MYFSVKTQCCFIAIVRRFIPLMETHKLNQSYKAEIPSQNKQSRLLASTFKVSPLWAVRGARLDDGQMYNPISGERTGQ